MAPTPIAPRIRGSLSSVRERERVCVRVCVFVCVWERECERESERARERKRERERERKPTATALRTRGSLSLVSEREQESENHIWLEDVFGRRLLALFELRWTHHFVDGRSI